MTRETKQPTALGAVILERLEQQSLSIAELERRTILSKNTILNAIYGPRLSQRKTIEILAEALDLPVESLTRASSRCTEPRFREFSGWLWRIRNGSLWVSVLGALFTAWLLLGDRSGSAHSTLVYGTHFTIILILLARLPRGFQAPDSWPVADPKLRLALAAAQDFRRYWGAAWMAWLGLYLALTLAAYLGLVPSPDLAPSNSARWLTVGFNLAQNTATILLFLCYEVVARPTIRTDLTRKQVLPLEAWVVLAILLPALEAWSLLQGVPWQTQQWFGWVAGFAQGMALALLVGRLDSKTIDPPPWVVALLYFYACIQGAWPVLQFHDQLMLIMTFLALFLKCLLFLFVAWLFESQILLYFLKRIRELHQGLKEERDDFLRQIPSD